jgi:hypothetical protein
MYHKFSGKPKSRQLFTKPLEESLEKSWTAISGQLDLITKIQQVFGEFP